jgi:hypothetical protein
VLGDPSYRAGARRLGDRLRRDAAGQVLVEEIEGLGRDSQVRPASAA